MEECNNRIIGDDKTLTTKELECPTPIPPPPPPSLNIKNESIKSLAEDKVEKCDITPENLSKKFDRNYMDHQSSIPPPSHVSVGCLVGDLPCFDKPVVMETNNKVTAEDLNKNARGNNDDNVTHDQTTTNSIKSVQSSGTFPKSASAFELKSLGGDSDTTKKSSKNELKIKEDDDDDDEEKPQRPSPLAFTIDFGDGGRPVDNEKYRNMLDKFQNRHRRGQSLSKIEDTKKTGANVMTSSGGGLGLVGGTGTTGKQMIRPPMSAKLPRRTLIKTPGAGANSESSFSSEQEDNNAPVVATTATVKLRDRSRNNVTEQSKRHSWSPRTSGVFGDQPKIIKCQPEVMKALNRQNQPQTKFTPQSSTLAQVLDGNYRRPAKVVDVVCAVPPLEHVVNSDDESVSEAGTYTLDSDQYTEEQKEKMSIDKLAQQRQEQQRYMDSKMTADSLEILDLDEDRPTSVIHRPVVPASPGRKNVLEISVFHNEPTSVMPSKPKTSYLEKIKSRVKTVGLRGRSKNDPPPDVEPSDGELPSPDVGCFTSVTTSGVLSVKPCLEPNPKARLTRRNSLTKSHLDASEYVAGRSRLNLNQPAQQKKRSGYGENGEFYVNDVENEEKLLNCLPHDEGCSSSSNDLGGGGVNLSETIKTAATKNDWITEWAKYAREYAQKTPTGKASSQPPAGNLGHAAFTGPPPGIPHSSPSRHRNGGPGNGAMTRSYEFDNLRTKQQQNDNNNFDCDENYSVMTKSTSDDYSNYDDEFGDNLDRRNGRPKILSRHQITPHGGQVRGSQSQQMRSTFHPPSSPSNEYSDGNENFNFQHRNSLRRGSHGNTYYPDREDPMTIGMIATSSRPPMSPSKIPSPIHSISRARGPATRNRSRSGSNTVSLFLINFRFIRHV